jgi:hypothetical protein
MNKATPIPDSIHRIDNGSIEKATCLPCGGKITRSVSGYILPWWHIETKSTRCAQKGGK